MMEFLVQVAIMIAGFIYVLIQYIAGMPLDSSFSNCNRMTDPKNDDYVTVQLETVSVTNGVTSTAPFVCKRVRIHKEDPDPVNSDDIWDYVLTTTKTNEEGKLFLKKSKLGEEDGYLFHGEGNYNKTIEGGILFQDVSAPVIVSMRHTDECDTEKSFRLRWRASCD